MSNRELKNKPLVEAIFEVRWKLQRRQPGIAVDPHYRLLLGRLYDRLHDKYPAYEQLDSANVPDEMAGHLVQHRFRASKDGWPLVQIGPGILTVNDTDGYRWEDFRPRVLDAIKSLYEAHPKQQDMQAKSLMLRYVDAVEFDYSSADVREFLRDKLKVNIDLPSNLFEDTGVQPLPQQLLCQQAYRSSKPAGVVQVRLATGERSSRQAVIWETLLQTANRDMPSMTEGFDDWLKQSHDLVNDWFFKMIEGELESSFAGDRNS